MRLTSNVMTATVSRIISQPEYDALSGPLAAAADTAVDVGVPADRVTARSDRFADRLTVVLSVVNAETFDRLRLLGVGLRDGTL